MGLSLNSQQHIAWSVSADHLVVRYGPLNLVSHSQRSCVVELSYGTDNFSQEQGLAPARAYKTAYPGRAAVSVRDDGRILAIAGWDGL